MRRITTFVFAGLAVCVCSALMATKAERMEIVLPPESDVVEVEYAENPNENELIEQALLAQANVIEDCRITYYCAERRKHICGLGQGITASGEELVPYHTCAVDPSVIPLGSQVMVDFGDGVIHYYFADDVGGGVKGNYIDICLPTHRECFEQPYNTATVYWLEE